MSEATITKRGLDPALKAEGDRRAAEAWEKLERGERAVNFSPGPAMMDPEQAPIISTEVEAPAPKKSAPPKPKPKSTPVLKPAAEDVDEDAVDEEADEEIAEEDAPASAPDEEGEQERERRQTVLNRSKLPRSVIEKMSPEELDDFVKAQGKQLSDADDAFRELRTIKTTREESAPKPNESRDATPPVVPISFEDAVKPLIAAGEFSEAAEPHLRKFAEAIATPLVQLVGQQAETIKSFQGMLVNLHTELGDISSERARDKFAGDYPELKEPAFYSRLRDKMKTLAKTGDYKDSAPTLQERIEIVMSDALRILAPRVREKNAARNSTERKRAAGQVRPQSRPKSKEAMSMSEKQWEGWQRLERGEDPRVVHADLFAGP